MSLPPAKAHAVCLGTWSHFYNPLTCAPELKVGLLELHLEWLRNRVVTSWEGDTCLEKDISSMRWRPVSVLNNPMSPALSIILAHTTSSKWGWLFRKFYKLTLVQKLVVRMAVHGIIWKKFYPICILSGQHIDYNIFSQSISCDTRFKMCPAKNWLHNQVSLKYCIPQPLSRVPIHINLLRRVFSFSVKKHWVMSWLDLYCSQ